MSIHLVSALAAVIAFAAGAALAWLYQKQRRTAHPYRENDVEHLALQIDVIEYFSRSAYQDSSQEDILWDIAEHCIAQLGFEDCVIYLLNEERQVWEQKAAYGPKKLNYREIHQPIVIALNAGIVGSVGASGQSEIVEDTRLDDRYILDDDMRLSEMAVPIIADGRVIGVIDSEHPDIGFYRPHHLRIVENIAAVCAHKIARTLSEREVANYASFFQRNPNPVFRVNRQHVVILANGGCAAQLSELVTLQQPVDQPELKAAIDRVFADQQPTITRIASGEQIFQFNIVMSISGESVNAYATEVTDLEKARSLAQQAERAKADFLSVMSHEIRTPLNAILGLNALLLNSAASSESERMQYLTEMGSAGRHLLALINNILDFEQINAGKMEFHRASFDAPAAFHELISIFNQQAHQSECVLSLSLPDDMPQWLCGERNWLMQMMTNLVGNALKFTRGGHVEISAQPDGKTDFWRIDIRDSGPGISAADLERIFIPFEQLRHGEKNVGRRGSGLGLAITRRLAQLHGGTLQAESTLGEGSCFTLRLPLPEDTAPAVAELPTAASTGAHTAHQRVLVVDDNAVNVLVVQRMLEQWGYETLTASDGKQAIEAWQEHQPDIILMDLQMPTMDGVEAAQHIRREELDQQRPPVPILALTADAQSDTKESALQAGMVDVIVKPVDPDLLRRRVAQHGTRRAN